MVIKETLRDHHPREDPTILDTAKAEQSTVGFNARVPVKDITLPRGAGPDGKSPIAVLKGTQIST